MPLKRSLGKDTTGSPREPAVDPGPALATGSVEERWAAARRIGVNESTRHLLAAALQSEMNPQVREALFTTLARARTAISVEIALPLLRSNEAALRTGALDMLRTMPDQVASHLTGLLHDADADVRLLACELARNQPVPEAIRMLSEVVSKDEVANVCSAAIEVLAEVAGPEAIPMLRQCGLRFPSDPFLAFAVDVAIRRISSQDGAPPQ